MEFVDKEEVFAVMSQITSHVDWIISTLMIVTALVQFVLYSLSIYKHHIMLALFNLGMACISTVAALGISLPRLIHEGAGIASLPVLACLALGLVLVIVAVVGSIPSLIGKYLPRLSGKHSATTATASHD